MTVLTALLQVKLIQQIFACSVILLVLQFYELWVAVRTALAARPLRRGPPQPVIHHILSPLESEETGRACTYCGPIPRSICIVKNHKTFMFYLIATPFRSG